MICHKSDINSIDLVVESLKKENVVILPTDTVYGFSSICNGNPETDKKIKIIKGRAETKPFIQLIADPEDIFKYTEDKIPEKFLKYWPGSLTIIVSDKRLKDCAVKTTAFRCPGDEWLRKIIKKADFPVYSTSVKRSGNPVLDEEDKIIAEFEKEVDLIVLDGDKKNALPSTIIAFENENVKILRQGAVKINL